MISRTARRGTAPKVPSLLDEYMETAAGRAELAAADLAAKVSDLLQEAFENSGVTAAEVAEALGLSQGRISQIRHGDGNLRISTLAKLLSALGQSVDIHTATSHRDDRHHGQIAPVAKWSQLFADDHGVFEHEYVTPTRPGCKQAYPLQMPRSSAWSESRRTAGRAPAGIWSDIKEEFAASGARVSVK